jgi:hypothetical protein
MVEPLSPMALPRRASGGVFGFRAVSSKQPNSRLTPQEDRLGTIDLHESDHFLRTKIGTQTALVATFNPPTKSHRRPYLIFPECTRTCMVSLVFRRFHPRSPVHAGKTQNV